MGYAANTTALLLNNLEISAVRFFLEAGQPSWRPTKCTKAISYYTDIIIISNNYL